MVGGLIGRFIGWLSPVNRSVGEVVKWVTYFVDGIIGRMKVIQVLIVDPGRTEGTRE